MASFGQQDAQTKVTAQQFYIDTPEQVELQFAVAGIGSRFVALLLDHLLQFGAMIALILVFAVIASIASSGSHEANDMAEMTTAGKWAIALLIFVVFCSNWGYFALFEGLWHGQTPGKRVMKLRVIKDSGRQITFFEALARNLIRVVDYLPGMYLAGVITMLCNKQNKRLGDLAAGTLVVHEAREEPLMIVHESLGLRPASETEWRPPTTSGLFPADAVARLSAADLAVIDTFFGRALDLSIEVREAMALRVARQMTAKMGVALPEGNPERALEAVAIAMRGGARSYP